MKKENIKNILFSFLFFMISIYVFLHILNFRSVVNEIVSTTGSSAFLVTSMFFVVNITLLVFSIYLDFIFLNRYYYTKKNKKG